MKELGRILWRKKEEVTVWWVKLNKTAQNFLFSPTPLSLGWRYWNFSLTYRSGRTMALGLTQPLTEMSTRSISWEVKAAGAYSWQHYQFHVPTGLKSGGLNLRNSLGLSRPVIGLLYLFFYSCESHNEEVRDEFDLSQVNGQAFEISPEVKNEWKLTSTPHTPFWST